MKELVLIDGNSLLNRAFYATKLLSTKDGTPTNAVFGFVKLLLKIIDDYAPDRLIVTFDLKAPTFRHKMYDGYKATRKHMPDDLVVQVGILKSLLRSMKICMYEKEGYVMDTHTAVSSCVYEKYVNETKDTAKTMIASTASPYKFARSVMEALGEACVGKDDFQLVDELERLSGVIVPKAVEEIRTAPVRHTRVCDAENMKEEVCQILGIH